MRAVEEEGDVRSSQRLGSSVLPWMFMRRRSYDGGVGLAVEQVNSVTFYSGHRHDTAHLWFHLICLPALLYNNRAALSPANLPSVAHEDAHNAYQHPLLKILPCDLVVEHP